MLVKQKTHGYSSKRKYVYGSGFSDMIKNIGSYVLQNKDLIAKPLLGAAGDLAALGLTEVGMALLKRLNKKKTQLDPQKEIKLDTKLDAKSLEILKNINNYTPTTNIIGSGIKKF